MTLKRRNSGSWADPTTLKRMHSGSWVGIDFIRRRGGGGWSIVYQSINIANQTISRVASTATTAGYRLNTSGIAEKREGGSYTTLETWLAAGSSSGYESRATLQSGSALTSGNVGTWENLGTSREWQQQSASGEVTSTLLIEIRNATTLVVVDSATITLVSEKL